MQWKSWSAGRIICSRQIFLILILFISLSCKPQQQNDPQIDQLRKDVRRLSEENQRLTQEVESLRAELQKKEFAPPPVNPETQPAEESMTIDRMKKEVAPILKDTIEKIKITSETPKNGKRFGMRVNYDMKNAVYGLVKTDDESAPYSAKIIVKFEKFLESGDVSRSYGSGSSTFVFAYRNKQWILQSYQ